MSKTNYQKTTKRKVHLPICGDCILDPSDCDLKVTDYYWVQRTGYRSLACVKCIEKEKYVIVKPYSKKVGRPKKPD